jgi:hypothetical protein
MVSSICIHRERNNPSSWLLSYFCCLGTDVLGQFIVPIFKGLDVKMDILIIEDGKDTMSWNVGYLTSKFAQQARKAKVSTNLCRKHEVYNVQSGAENALDNYHEGICESALCVDWKYEMKCNMFSFGCFPGVWVLIADVSEPSIGSIFIGRSMHFPIGSATGLPEPVPL